MSDSERPGLAKAGLELGHHVVRSLAPQFLALVIVNALFLVALFWFVDGRARHTAELISQLLANCLQK